MTQRLYFTDSMLADFEADVVSCTPAGDAFDLVLDRTAFYPTSGGQPFDTGTLDAARVLDVTDDEGGAIVHRTSAAFHPGARVRGRVDWPRRLDHMQQHTGQHVLSAAFDRLFGVRTTSFHLGADASTIDLAREVGPGEIARAESLANDVVQQSRPVAVRFVTEAEAAALPLRKEPVKTGTLRLIEVADFDLSACGGTHVPQTGMIGGIGVAGWERFKGASRVTFVCGARLLRSHARLRDIAAAASRVLSVGADDLASSVQRVQTEAKEHAREVRRLQEELAQFRATALRGSSIDSPVARVVFHHEVAADATSIKALATAVVSEPGHIAVIVGDGSPTPVVAARSADVVWDAGAWLKQATAALGGRGGGRPELAQGGLSAPPNAIRAFVVQSFNFEL